MVRHRPREAAELVTNDEDLSKVAAYQEYYKCGWPKVARTVNVDFNYEVLTVGSDWVVDSLNYQIPKEAEAVLGVKKCNSNRREDDSNDGFVRRAAGTTFSSTNAGILRVSSAKSGIFGDATRTSQCTWLLKKDVNGNGNDGTEPVCTQVEGKAAVVYDPELTDAEHATKKTMEAISEVLMGGESRGGSSLVTGNIVGLRMVEKTNAAETSDTDTVNVFTIMGATPKGGMPIDNSKGMSGGEIAGIVIGLLLLTGLMTMLVVRRRRQQASKGHRLAGDDDETQYGRKTIIGDAMRVDLGFYHHADDDETQYGRKTTSIGDATRDDVGFYHHASTCHGTDESDAVEVSLQK